MAETRLQRIVENSLPDRPALHPFALAVVTHLSRAAEGSVDDARAGERAVAIRELAEGRGGDLRADPPLLASLFQNADLLDPYDPASARIANAVMLAIADPG